MSPENEKGKRELEEKIKELEEKIKKLEQEKSKEPETEEECTINQPLIQNCISRS